MFPGLLDPALGDLGFDGDSINQEVRISEAPPAAIPQSLDTVLARVEPVLVSVAASMAGVGMRRDASNLTGNLAVARFFEGCIRNGLVINMGTWRNWQTRRT